MLAERVAHERRNEVTEERSRDTGEKPAQADDQQRAVWGLRLTRLRCGFQSENARGRKAHGQ